MKKSTINQVIAAENEQGIISEIAVLKATIKCAQYPDPFDGMFGLPNSAEQAEKAAQRLAELLVTQLDCVP